jgi:DNA polymerase III alpha subunit
LEDDDEPDGAVNPGGLVLGDARLLERMPVEPSVMGLPVSQFGRHDLGSLGLFTVDVVGMPVQSVMASAVREARRIHGIDVDLDALPLDGETVFERFGDAPDAGPAGYDPAAAFVAHQTAWLKARHPEAYLAGMLEHNAPGPSRQFLLAEAGRRGVPILPVDINLSGDMYRVELIEDGPDAGRLGIRLPLKGVRGLSRGELGRVTDGQPFASLAEVRARAGLRPRSFRRLAELGAFDSLHGSSDWGSRADLVAHLAELAARPSGRGAGPIVGQLALNLGVVQPTPRPAPRPAGPPRREGRGRARSLEATAPPR